MPCPRNLAHRTRHRVAGAFAAALAVVALVTAALPVAAEASRTLVVTGTLTRVVVDPDITSGHADHAADHDADHDDGLVTRDLVAVDGALLAVPAALREPVAASGTGTPVRVTLAVRGSRPRAQAVAGLAAGRSDGATVVGIEPAGGRSSAAAARSVLGAHRLTILPVYWTARDAATAGTLTETGADLARFWGEQSGGGIDVHVAVRDWQRIPDPGSCATTALYNAALAAHAVPAPASAAEHVLVYFPHRADCGWAGLATIGGSQIWDNGYELSDVVTHEFGHNLGLGHANLATCTGNGGRVSLSATCSVQEYDDSADVMGYATYDATGNLNTAFADYLGLARVVEASAGAPTTVTLAPLGDVAAVRGIRVPTPRGPVYVDFRPAAGRDVRRPDWAGVQVHLRTEGRPPTTQLLDLQTDTAAFSAPNLPAWQVWAIPGTAVALKVTLVGATATVQVVPTAGDTIPPSRVTPTTPVGGQTLTPGSSVSWPAATDAGTGVGAYTVVLDGVRVARTAPDMLSATLPVVKAGRHTLRIDATDDAGNVESGDVVPFTVSATGGGGVADRTPPGAPIVTAPASGAAVRTRAATVSWRESADPESGVTAYRVTVGTTTTTVAPGVRSLAVRLVEGLNAITVTAVNGAGLTATSSAVKVVADTVAPAPPSALTLTADGARLTWRPPAGESALTYRVAVDGRAPTIVTGPAVSLALTGGRHTVSVRAADPAGNLSKPATLTRWTPRSP